MVKTKGFTLIEVMIVISIIGILASIAVPRVAGYLDIAKNSKAITIGKQLSSAAMWSYSEQGGKFESTKVVEAISTATGIQNITTASITVTNSSNLSIVYSSDSKNFIVTINAASNSYLILCDSKTIFSSLQQ